LSGQVQLALQGALAFVTLSHPGKFNAMSRLMWRQLREVFEDLQQRQDLRVVLLRGEAGHFCAGGDISEYPGFRFDAASLREFHENDVWGGLNAVLDCDITVLAQINGNCMGAGMELASCCDLRLAGRSARFGAPIAKLGFPMAPREAALVARVAGEVTAREMLLAAAVLDAPTLAQRGFLNRICEDDALEAEALAAAWAISLLAPQAARQNKQTLRHLATVQVPADAYAYADTAEHREGVTAFMEKRQPRF
jgi:enoyl-CoA hydratase/carnithine racemase